MSVMFQITSNSAGWQLVKASNKGNIKSLITGPLWGESLYPTIPSPWLYSSQYAPLPFSPSHLWFQPSIHESGILCTNPLWCPCSLSPWKSFPSYIITTFHQQSTNPTIIPTSFYPSCHYIIIFFMLACSISAPTPSTPPIHPLIHCLIHPLMHPAILGSIHPTNYPLHVYILHIFPLHSNLSFSTPPSIPLFRVYILPVCLSQAYHGCGLLDDALDLIRNSACIIPRKNYNLRVKLEGYNFAEGL